MRDGGRREGMQGRGETGMDGERRRLEREEEGWSGKGGMEEGRRLEREGKVGERGGDRELGVGENGEQRAEALEDLEAPLWGHRKKKKKRFRRSAGTSAEPGTDGGVFGGSHRTPG